MEPSNPNEQFEPSHAAVPADDATVEIPRQRAEPIQSTASSVTGQHCAACGATLAPDQRYCVECGQRRGPTRPPFLETLGGQPTQRAAATPPKRKPRISPNTALIAGIGTLMLAMATGVLIGRTSAPSTKSAPVEYVNAPAASGTPTTTTGSSTPTTPTSTTEGSSSTNSGGGKGGGSSKAPSSSAAAKVLKGSNAPTKSVVKQGSAGKGPGYQKGHFTGKFFGGGSSSKKTEEEEELGEESSGKGGK